MKMDVKEIMWYLKNFSKSNDVKETSFWFKYFDLNFWNNCNHFSVVEWRLYLLKYNFICHS